MTIKKDTYDLPDYQQIADLYSNINRLIKEGLVYSAYAIGQGGLVEAVSKMAFGNKLGVYLEEKLTYKDLFLPDYGSILLEMSKEDASSLLADDCQIIGEVIKEEIFKYKGQEVSLEEAIDSWTSTLEEIYPTKTDLEETKLADTKLYDAKNYM